MDTQDTNNEKNFINRRDAIKRTALAFGVALSSATITNCLAVDRSKNGTGSDWSPRYISSKYVAVLNAATELIIPRTDTPGAIDVAVPQLIDVLYGKYMFKADRDLIDAGLAKLHAENFHKKSEKKQTSIMMGMAKSDDKQDKAFLTQLRSATITGYFTSEEVMKNVTTYDPIPGRYDACVPISETGNVVMSEPR